jgi:uncharacterized protein (UPF0335 family)
MATKSELQEMVQELEKAFNETVCESDRIAEVLADIKASGYDVMLALEVTVGVTAEQRSAGETPKRSEQPVTRNGELLLTGEDREFLHGLRIGD